MTLVDAVRAILGKQHKHRFSPRRIRRGEDGTPVIFIETGSGQCSVYVPLRYFSNADKAVIYQSRLVLRDVVRTPHQVLETAPPSSSPRDLFLSSNSVVFPSCTLTPACDGGFLLAVPASSRSFPLAEDRPLFRLTPGLMDSVIDTVCAGVTGSETATRVVEVFLDGDYQGVFTLATEAVGEFVAHVVDLSAAPSVACFDEGVRVGGSSHFLCARDAPEKSAAFAAALSDAWDDASRWDPTTVFHYALRCTLTGGARWCTVLEGTDSSFSTARFLTEPASLSRQPAARPITGPIATVLAATGVSKRLDASLAAALHHLAELESRMRANPALIASMSRDRLLKHPHDAMSSLAASARDEVWLNLVRDRAVSDLCARIASRLLLDNDSLVFPGDAPE